MGVVRENGLPARFNGKLEVLNGQPFRFRPEGLCCS